MSRAWYEIPLSPEPQSLSIVLAGKEYRLTVRWFEAPEGGWLLDIDDAETGQAIVHGIPLVVGLDLLAPYEYLNFGGALVVDSELPPHARQPGRRELPAVRRAGG